MCLENNLAFILLLLQMCLVPSACTVCFGMVIVFRVTFVLCLNFYYQTAQPKATFLLLSLLSLKCSAKLHAM